MGEINIIVDGNEKFFKFSYKIHLFVENIDILTNQFFTEHYKRLLTTKYDIEVSGDEIIKISAKL